MSSISNHGLIAQLVDREGKVFSRVFGYYDPQFGARTWLGELVEYCDNRDLRVQVISSPATILKDIRCREFSRAGRECTHFPEEESLGQLGRADLVDPSARVTWRDPSHLYLPMPPDSPHNLPRREMVKSMTRLSPSCLWDVPAERKQRKRAA
jgi:hypothetical protein